jgi:hypothetical protein
MLDPRTVGGASDWTALPIQICKFAPPQQCDARSFSANRKSLADKDVTFMKNLPVTIGESRRPKWLPQPPNLPRRQWHQTLDYFVYLPPPLEPPQAVIVPLGRKIHRLPIQPGWPTSNVHQIVPQLVEVPFREDVGAHGGFSWLWLKVATADRVVDSVVRCQEAYRREPPAEPQGRRPAKPLAASPAPRITNKLSKDANPEESV